MTTAEITVNGSVVDKPPRSWQHRIVTRVFHNIEFGQLKIRLNDGSCLQINAPSPGPTADITFHALTPVLFALWWKGDIGFAESYMSGRWDTSDLARLMYFLSLNLDALEEHDQRSLLQKWLTSLDHWLNSNTPSGSKRNIAAHYDLGNEFYSRWLDKSMTYSSALFEDTHDLEEAQHRKYQRILDRLDAKPGDHILEIGCGWGGFAEFAARSGYLVTGITLSRQQLDHARKRINTAGLDHRVFLEIMDYRAIDKQYDHIVSIEMIEAVGQKYWNRYFDMLKQSLKPGGNIVIQSITIKDELFDDYKNNPGGFIQRYIFPGGMLPTSGHLDQQARKAGLKLVDSHAFGEDYATTLAVWHECFNREEVWLEENGYDDYFRRMWRYYLTFCEAGFRDHRIDVVQMHFRHNGQAGDVTLNKSHGLR
jgi:cyclopropane-fatty-acyl-phospholipid synthase